MNTQIKGVINGVEFEYTAGTTIRGRCFIYQKLLVLKGLIIATRLLLSRNKEEPIAAFILYPERFLTVIWFYIIAKICGATYILEKSERPFLKADKSLLGKLYSNFYTHTVYKLFDGMILISNNLWEYMSVRIRRNARLLKIPILVDTDQFKPYDHDSKHGKYIAYCGTLNEAKDGVLTLLCAFASVSYDYPDVSLMLIGDGYKKSEIPVYRMKAEELGVSERVIFTGFLSRDILPKYLGQASILALARPSSLQADAGFPTKLGEYLASGNPVIVTRTGEIDTYLNSGIDVYFAEPDSVKSFADTLRCALSDQAVAMDIGRRGREAAIRYFDYRENGRKIKNFVNGFRNRN